MCYCFFPNGALVVFYGQIEVSTPIPQGISSFASSYTRSSINHVVTFLGFLTPTPFLVTFSQRTEERLNLNFQAHPYSIWDDVFILEICQNIQYKHWIQKSILRPKKEGFFCSFMTWHFKSQIFEFLAEFWVKFWCDGKKMVKKICRF